MNAISSNYMIVLESHGGYSVFPATLKNAMDIFNEYVSTLDSEVLNIVNEKTQFSVSGKVISQILVEVLETPVGSPLTILRKFLYGAASKEGKDVRPEVYNIEANIQHLAMFMVMNNLTKDMIKNGKTYTSLDYSILDPINNLVFFSEKKDTIKNQGRKIVYITYEDYFSMADGYSVIKNGKWKEGAAEHKIVNHILEYVNKYLVDSSDMNFEVVSYSESYKT